ncbi:ankyrin repeat-containing protein BDA1-like [Pistacia vera]|uniref:ankyrin repeat-containing protein BDA1-like n=1 Tax=Pistacia vera TaxID=55513 RepID=UPI0012633E16|nr:ankyrin repeat-containing protein BDA1-like [Pistacia vera]
MDSSMFVAAKEGNTQLLLQLLHDDPLILERVTTSSSDTPLHVAAMFGHSDFVKEIIKHKSNAGEYVKELNQNGFGATHMAAANGHNETVLELLKVNNELGNLKGKDGMTPLHCACTK